MYVKREAQQHISAKRHKRPSRITCPHKKASTKGNSSRLYRYLLMDFAILLGFRAKSQEGHQYILEAWNLEPRFFQMSPTGSVPTPGYVCFSSFFV